MSANLLWWAIPDVLAGMPMPYLHLHRRMSAGGALLDYDDDLPILHSAGVRAVVSLLNLPGDARVYDAAGFDFLCLPIPDGQPPSTNQAMELARFVSARQSAGKPVAVHCEAGLGRTGTMLAAYLISQGHTAASAIRRIREAESSAIETSRQIRFLEEFANRRDSEISKD